MQTRARKPSAGASADRDGEATAPGREALVSGLSEGRLRAIAEQSFELMMIVDGERVVRWANSAFERVLGYPAEEIVGGSILPLVHPDDLPGLVETIERLGATPGSAGTADFRLRATDESWHSMETAAKNLFDEPDVRGFVVSLRDVTRKVQAETALRESEKRYRDLFEHASDAVYTADLEGNFTSVNPAAERISGFTRAELLGMNLIELIAPEDKQRTQEILAREFVGSREEKVDLQLVAKDGRRIFLEVNGRQVARNGGPGHMEGIARDTTQRHFLEQKLREKALHDDLTGLPNRTLLLDRARQAIGRRERTGSAVAVMLLDVDDFKLVNDALGHVAGDQLLVEIGRRLTSVVRAGETVARLGGDEFALVAEIADGPDGVVALAERVRSAFGSAFRLGRTRLRVSASIGVTLAKKRDTPQTLLRDADTAMYRAKAGSKGGWEIFDAAMRARLRRQLALATALEDAVSNSILTVEYQPVMSVDGAEILAVEALSRWTHPRWGPIEPTEFIPLAEDNGLIVPIGHHVLSEAARQVALWRHGDPEALPLGVFVNISPRELLQETFIPFFDQILRENGLTGSEIAFELTERAFVDERDDTLAENLDELARRGARLILDDFGTGYSALASLRRIPLIALKIDRQFIDKIRNADDDAAITRAIAGLGKSLGLLVVAEGVEDAAQLECIRSLGCDAVQGFHMEGPQSAESITRLLGSRLHRAA